MGEFLPKLRLVEAHPVQENNRTLFALRDPSGYSHEIIAVSAEVLFIAQHFDGKTTMLDLQANYQRQFGEMLVSDKVHGIIDLLDNQLLIENDRFENYVKKLIAEFETSSVRKMTCFNPEEAGADELREFIDGCMQLAGYSPGPEIEPSPSDLVGIIAPHIDYIRGQKVYGEAYGPFFSGFDGDTVIIFGTNHQEPLGQVILCSKDFETPFGTMPTDSELVEKLSKSIQGDPFKGQIVHRTEHSIELAATMLAYAGWHKKVKIVPILVSGLEEFIHSGKDPLDDPMISSTVDAIRSVIKENPGGVAIIASADLAHIGQQFDDPFLCEEKHLSECKSGDMASLETLSTGDYKGFYGSIASDKNARKVCGLAPITLAGACLDPFKARIAGYSQWVHPEKFGSVSFGGLVLNRQTSKH